MNSAKICELTEASIDSGFLPDNDGCQDRLPTLELMDAGIEFLRNEANSRSRSPHLALFMSCAAGRVKRI